jgi:hypothetical protein
MFAGPDIARLWKRPDGTVCVVRRRTDTLYVCLQRDDLILKEQPVDSPREAMDVANAWLRELRGSNPES